MAVLGLRFCARAFCSCGKWGPLFIAMRGHLTITASPVAEHRLQTRRLSNCGSRAQSLRGMWDLPRPGPEPVSPALAGRFSTTAPPGKPPSSSFLFDVIPLGFFCFCCLYSWCQIQKIIAKTSVEELIPYVFIKNFTVLGFTCKSLIHF